MGGAHSKSKSYCVTSCFLSWAGYCSKLTGHHGHLKIINCCWLTHQPLFSFNWFNSESPHNIHLHHCYRCCCCSAQVLVSEEGASQRNFAKFWHSREKRECLEITSVTGNELIRIELMRRMRRARCCCFCGNTVSRDVRRGPSAFSL